MTGWPSYRGQTSRLGDVLVMTDGNENASWEWTNSAVRRLIQRQGNTYRWDFVFLGSNIDAVEVGADLGVHRDKAMTHVSRSAGMTAAFDAVAVYRQRKWSAVLARLRCWLSPPQTAVESFRW